MFQSLDPGTALPPDVLTGFLPPEDGTGIGKAHVSFSIQPQAGLTSGTALRNVGLIRFDGQTYIATNQVDPQNAAAGTDPNKEALNTIDGGPPTSSVSPLPSVSETTHFVVGWSGSDDADGRRGSGISSYDVYVSDNGAPFELFRSGSRDTSAVFSGLDGHTYQFYTVATDNVGHLEQAPTAADAQTRIVEKVDRIPPTLQIVSISPSPRLIAVEQIVFVFSEPVNGFDLSDLTLTQTVDRPVLLLPGNAMLSSADNRTWTLSNLVALTSDSGVYQLDVSVASSGIADFAGNPLASGARADWSMRPGDANSDRRFNSVDFVDVFQAGEYDDLASKNSTWSEGDWNGDGDFDSVDFVVAFQSGGYTDDDSELVPGDFDHDGIVDAADIDLISAQLRLPTPSLLFDLTQDNRTDVSDLDELIKHILRTSYGDANLDRVFNSGDFVQVFQRGTYEDAIFGNSGWSDGDWNADGDFDTGDLVLAFQAVVHDRFAAFAIP